MGLDPRLCPACGQRDEVPQLVDGPVAGGPAAAASSGGGEATLRCQACGAARSFLRLPLLCLTGPSGTGKSTVAALVGRSLADVVVTLEQDVLWWPELAHTAGGVRRFRASWLRLAAMAAQSGRPVLLCGTVLPAELEDLPERVLFSDIAYLALVCRPDVLADRLRTRPPWRGWDEGRIAEMLEYAEVVEREGPHMAPPLALLDTTGVPPPDTAALVEAWARGVLGAGGRGGGGGGAAPRR